VPPARIHDDRGREVPVYRPPLLSFHRDDALTLPEPDFQQLRRRLARLDPAGCAGNNAIIWLLLLWYVGNSLWRTVFGPVALPQLLLRLLFLALLGGFALLLHRRILPLSARRHPDIIRDVLLKMHRCPSCAFDLRAIAPAHDTARVCPECGAAWFLAEPETAVERPPPGRNRAE
jgi:hypothetical protein